MKSVSISSFIKASSYWSKLAGIRWQLLLSIVVIWILSLWLHSEYGQDDSNLWLVMNLFFQLVKWIIFGLFGISMTSAVITWLYFLNSVKRKAVTVLAKFDDGLKAEAGWVQFTVIIQGTLLRPLLGAVHARLVFSGNRVSDRVILDSNIARPRHWWRRGVRGGGRTLLHDRGIYDVEKVLVSFCDMLGLVNLPCVVPFAQQLYTLPRPQVDQKIQAQPRSTEEQKHRIEIPRRVEGEYVNYKEFETGDNIQRIVWKIYAKSGQLVVRIPETKDPYASHIYFYASFFHGFDLQNGAFETELLNVYKDTVRNLFESLGRIGYLVRIPGDQEVAKLSGLSEKKNELFQITAASWQSQMTPANFVDYNKAAFVCLSSLVPADEIEIILKNLPASVPVVVVKLSNAIASPFQMKLKDFFFRPEKQPTDALRQPWMLSSLRRRLKENEEDLSSALKARGNSWLTNDIEFAR